jgi:type II secretory pathway pseudopilin PulG
MIFSKANSKLRMIAGFVLMELIVVVLIMAVLIGFVSVNTVGVFNRVRLEGDLDTFRQTLRLACEQAVFSGKTYIVDIEVTDGYYTVYAEAPKEGPNEEVEILIDEQQLKWCYIDEIEFRNGAHQYSGGVKLKATPKGWDDTLLFVLTDEFDQWRYLRCDRLTAQVTVSRQLLEMPKVFRDVSMSSPI